jgi:hypothetical protein
MHSSRSAHRLRIFVASALAIAAAGSGAALAPSAQAQSSTCQAYTNRIASLQQMLFHASSDEKPSIIREIVQTEKQAAAAGCST